MNKRAKKRIKESIEKKNVEHQQLRKAQTASSPQSKELRGFTVKPGKKRG